MTDLQFPASNLRRRWVDNGRLQIHFGTADHYQDNLIRQSNHVFLKCKGVWGNCTEKFEYFMSFHALCSVEILLNHRSQITKNRVINTLKENANNPVTLDWNEQFF